MNRFATFEIPVAPHVYKFLASKYGEVYKVSQTDLLGMMIIPYLTKKVNVVKKSTERKITDQTKTKTYTIAISYDYFVRQGFYLSYDQLKFLGRIADRYFREVLFSHVAITAIDNPKSQMKSIVNFCEAYNIGVEDIDPRTLYRDFYRKREDLHQNLEA